LPPKIDIVQVSEKFFLHGQTLWLSPNRCIYWEEEKTLLVSDLHLGKTGHFRKSGIAVPQAVYKEDLQRLLQQLQYFKPEQLIVVGDLFHSTANKELELFIKWRNDFSEMDIRLVLGNHDILKKNWYSEANISVSDKHLSISSFCFVHDIQSACAPAATPLYYFSGHIHPCITLNGLGKQSLKFPCFYFSSNYAVLPAFSKFTGTAHIEPKPKDSVFAILPANLTKGEQAAVVKV
jgi:DNA ligase-associated metallophosphoesterase